MAIVQLPDGDTIQVPDDATPDQVALAGKKVQAMKVAQATPSAQASYDNSSPAWKALVGISDSMHTAVTRPIIPGVEQQPMQVNDPWHPSSPANTGQPLDPMYDLRPMLNLWRTDPARAAGQMLPFLAAGAAGSDAAASAARTAGGAARGAFQGAVDAPTVSQLLPFVPGVPRGLNVLPLAYSTVKGAITGGVDAYRAPALADAAELARGDAATARWIRQQNAADANVDYYAGQSVPQGMQAPQQPTPTQPFTIDLQGVPKVYREQVQAAPFVKDPLDAIVKDKMILKFMLQRGYTKQAFDALNLAQKKALIRDVPTPNKSPYRWSDDLDARAAETIRQYLPDKK